VAAAYAAALAALPADLRPGPLSDAAEAARLLADGLPLGRLSAILEGLPSGAGESSPGPPRVRLRPEGGLPVALGTGSIAALHLSWSGPLGEAPAGILWLPPRVLVPGADLVLPVGLDHPRSPGLWRLSVRTESGEDLRTTGTCQRMIPETLDWIGPRIACDFSSGGFPLRPTRDGAALEILSGLPDQLVFPPMPAPGERLSVRVELTVWPAGDAPWIPILGSGSTTRALGRAAAGVRTTLIGEIPVPPGPLDLALRFPDRAALVDLHRISVEPAT
jgi:hypothetical protein